MPIRSDDLNASRQLQRKNADRQRGAFAALAAPLLLLADPLPAAPLQAIQQGMQVIDTSGQPVGVVTSIDGSSVIVKTDKLETRVPASSFTLSKGKLLFGMSREQLNDAAQMAASAARATLIAGTQVYGASGNLAGTIESADQDGFVVKLVSGERIRLKREALAPAPNGAVLGLSAEELQRFAAESTN